MIEEFAKQWIGYNYNYPEVLEVLPYQTNWGLVVYFYHRDTGNDLNLFLTVPMVQELLDGRNPKKVKNKYRIKTENMDGKQYANWQDQFKIGAPVQKSSFNTPHYNPNKIWIDHEPWIKSLKGKPNYKARSKRATKRLTVFERDDFVCLRCGSSEGLTIDHVIPKSKDGKNNNDNYQTLCVECNGWKGDRHIDYRNGKH